MPFKSEAQRRWMHAAAKRGEIPKDMPERWEKETPKTQLPEHVKKKKRACKHRASSALKRMMRR